MPVMGTVKFQQLFRAAAGLQVDRNDLKRYTDFIDDKIYDLILIGKSSAKANLRDVIEPWDLPITKGLQESIHRFEKLDQEIELQALLDQLTARPPLDMALSEATEQRLPLVAGGLSVALAHTFVTIEPDRKNPGTAEWHVAFDIFHLLL
ncbi:hypothetical protein B7C42_06879 [Nocardia cerradoensis]|uniref:DUF1931 domain-containing protein n=2 Tax=Nocardia cerradoensis TaxID=85688 RepID=A0A231GWY4_9NOCA|nr:hypothetical protein B7C42_06879 [Nocardia cerradoensis]